jgi:hypothetical protein
MVKRSLVVGLLLADTASALGTEWRLSADGTWQNPTPPPARGSLKPREYMPFADQTRSPGIINLLIWYYRNVERDARIVEVVKRFDRFLLEPEKAKAYGMLHRGAHREEPGIDSKW